MKGKLHEKFILALVLCFVFESKIFIYGQSLPRFLDIVGNDGEKGIEIIPWTPFTALYTPPITQKVTKSTTPVTTTTKSPVICSLEQTLNKALTGQLVSRSEWFRDIILCDFYRWKAPITNLNEYTLHLQIVKTQKDGGDRMPTVQVAGTRLKNIHPSTCIIIQTNKASCTNLDLDSCTKEIWISGNGNQVPNIDVGNFDSRTNSFELKYNYVKCEPASDPAPKQCYDLITEEYEQKKIVVIALGSLLAAVFLIGLLALLKLCGMVSENDEELPPEDINELGHVYGWW